MSELPGLTLAVGTVPTTPPERAGSTVQVWRDDGGAVCAYGYVLDGVACMLFPGFASYHLGREGRVTVMAQPSAQRQTVEDTYRRSVLPVALQVCGTQVLHASGVVAPRGVIAFCGRARSGKSTLAYAFARRGLAQWADDALPFVASPVAAEAIPLPFSPRLRPDAAAYFERLSEEGLPLPQPSQKAPSVPLAALLLLSRVGNGQAPQLRRLSAAEAFVSVLAHAFCFSLDPPGDRARMISQYLNVAGAVPTLEVRFPADLTLLSQVLDLIEGAIIERT